MNMFDTVAAQPLLVLAAVVMTLGCGYLLWQVLIRRLPIHHFGTHQVIEALRWEPLAQQQRLAAQGSLTRLQWFLLRRRHLIRLRTELRIR